MNYDNYSGKMSEGDVICVLILKFDHPEYKVYSMYDCPSYKLTVEKLKVFDYGFRIKKLYKKTTP